MIRAVVGIRVNLIVVFRDVIEALGMSLNLSFINIGPGCKKLKLFTYRERDQLYFCILQDTSRETKL